MEVFIGLAFAIIFIIIFVTIFGLIIRDIIHPEHMIKDLHKKSNMMMGTFNNMKKMNGDIDGENNSPNVYCQNCGAMIEINSNFCKYCGKELFK